MPDYRLAARKAATKYGIDPDIFVAQLVQENGLKPTGRSGAGASGIAQFMPATAAHYGVNLNDGKVSDDLDGAARYMRDNLKQFGSYAKALAAYNAGGGAVSKYGGVPPFAETQKYVHNILAAAKASGSKQTAGRATLEAAGKGTSSGGSSGGSVTTTTSVTPNIDTTSNTQALQLLQQALAKPQATFASAGIAPPSFAAGPTLAGGAVASSGSGGPAAKQDIGSLLDLIQTADPTTPASGPTITQTSTSQAGSAPAGASSGGGSSAGGVTLGKVKINPGADRAGVSTGRGVLRLVGELAGADGHTLAVGTGTNHNRLSTSGLVSDHWTGNAADIPASGQRLTQLGAEALQTFGGMSRQEALKKAKQGGIFNLKYGKNRRIQVIVNTMEGGNHFNHLHVGVTPKGR